MIGRLVRWHLARVLGAEMIYGERALVSVLASIAEEIPA